LFDLKKKSPIVLIEKKKGKHCSSSPQQTAAKIKIVTIHHQNSANLENADCSVHQRRSHQDPRRQILLQKATPHATDRSHQIVFSGASTGPQQTCGFSNQISITKLGVLACDNVFD